MAIYYPPAFINAYLQDKVREEFEAQYRLANPGAIETPYASFTLPCFPTSPTAIEDLTSSFPAAADNVFAIYDRMFKMRRSPFPHVKMEQLLYYFYKTAGDPVDLIETTQIVQDLLDREDESAQELNSWAAIKQKSDSPLLDDNGAVRPTPFFHRIKVYQLEETRDIIDFGTARTFAGNKIIIDYEWHQ